MRLACPPASASRRGIQNPALPLLTKGQAEAFRLSSSSTFIVETVGSFEASGGRAVVTVGHSNHDLEHFIKLVQEARLQVVVDVRAFEYAAEGAVADFVVRVMDDRTGRVIRSRTFRHVVPIASGGNAGIVQALDYAMDQAFVEIANWALG